ncbi:MAG: hypothetical protein M1816_005513 [Peltula sp. TS41687]|nr:MAG: hypothetical protein M1816_005513 [Peltula sp. TS41687]
MPITFHPSNVPLSKVPHDGDNVQDASTILEESCQRNESIIQFSFTSYNDSNSSNSSNSSGSGSGSDGDDRQSAPSSESPRHLSSIRPSNNGLVDACLDAYNNHHHLTLRPDDIWIAILAQFGLYIDAHSERFRAHFVGHADKEHLVVEGWGDRHTMDFRALARRMTELVEKRVKHPELLRWMSLDFSTTTDDDRIVASIMVMATLRTYYSYEICLLCGLPGVTLEGERDDWVRLADNIEPLLGFQDDHLKTWHGLLKPVLTRFVASFDQPDSDAIKDFWQNIAHYRSGGSGSPTISGWLSAFCLFDKDGNVIDFDPPLARRQAPPLYLDGVRYPAAKTQHIAPAYGEVDVKLNDNGVEIETVMVAGLVGTRVSSSNVKRENHDGRDDSLRPQAGWWLLRRESVESDESDEQWR